jgi:hypothetical protein
MLRMRQPIDKAYRVPQPTQVALTPAPIHYTVHLEPDDEVARGFLSERQARPLGHLVREVRVRLVREGDLDHHLFGTEVRVVEADGYRAALGPGPLQHPRGHGKRPYLKSAATNVVPRLGMPPRSTAPSPKRAFARRASSLKLEAFAKRASLAKRASRRLCSTSVRICATRPLARKPIDAPAGPDRGRADFREPRTT